VEYASAEAYSHFCSVLWTNSEQIQLWAPGKSCQTGYSQCRETLADTNALDQFVIHAVDGELLVERGVRLGDGHLTTDREADLFEAALKM